VGNLYHIQQSKKSKKFWFGNTLQQTQVTAGIFGVKVVLFLQQTNKMKGGILSALEKNVRNVGLKQ
jgi:hypothetical protein